MKKSRRAEMGVGTMIIFIAMILVAAVAASVLISTANDVREQAESTGQDAINNVASGFIVQDVVGTAVVADDEVKTLAVYVKLAAGSPAVDLSDVIITFSDGALIADLTFQATGADATHFDADGVPSALTNNVAQAGDLVKIAISDADSNLQLAPGDAVEIKIIPLNGAIAVEQFTIPDVITTTTITLK